MQYISNISRKAMVIGAVALTTLPAYAQRNPQLREGMYETRDHKRSCLVMRDDDSHDKYEICDDASRNPALHTTVINGRLYSFNYKDGPEIKATKDSKETIGAQRRRNATVQGVQSHPTMSIGHFR